jgi:hypothetical protein
MNKLIWSIVFSIVSVMTFGQSGLITGRVVIDDGVIGQNTTKNINVTNQSNNAKTSTNENGMFSLKATVGDELVFNHDFYQERKVKITQEILAKGFVTVHLNIEVIQLGEAKVITLNKDWRKNLNFEKTEGTKLYESLGLNPNMQYHKVNPNASSMTNNNGLFDPSNWVATITGQKKQAKKQDEYFKKVEKMKSLENYFTRNYFIDNLEIPDYKVTDFVTYCYTNFELEKLVKENAYEKITKVFEDQAPKYLEMIKK